MPPTPQGQKTFAELKFMNEVFFNDDESAFFMELLSAIFFPSREI
jgi:hypothetical protein